MEDIEDMFKSSDDVVEARNLDAKRKILRNRKIKKKQDNETEVQKHGVDIVDEHEAEVKDENVENEPSDFNYCFKKMQEIKRL